MMISNIRNPGSGCKKIGKFEKNAPGCSTCENLALGWCFTYLFGPGSAKSILSKYVTFFRMLGPEKSKLFVAFVDFRKAYDKINRRLLLLKLQRAGVKGLLYENIKSIYETISYKIKIIGGHLTPVLSSIGLKQGGVLSSLLFNLYIDDMRFIFDSSCDPVTHFKDPLSHLLYADDLIMMSTTHTGLSNCLEKLEKYCDMAFGGKYYKNAIRARDKG